MTKLTTKKIRDILDEEIIKAVNNENIKRPVKWGNDDCGTWVAGILRNALGYDIAENFRGKYNDRASAKLLFGVTGLLGALKEQASLHGWKQIDPKLAVTGDVGLAMFPNENSSGKMEPTCAICRTRGWFIARSDYGLTAFDSTRLARAWSLV